MSDIIVKRSIDLGKKKLKNHRLRGTDIKNIFESIAKNNKEFFYLENKLEDIDGTIMSEIGLYGVYPECHVLFSRGIGGVYGIDPDFRVEISKGFTIYSMGVQSYEDPNQIIKTPYTHAQKIQTVEKVVYYFKCELERHNLI